MSKWKKTGFFQASCAWLLILFIPVFFLFCVSAFAEEVFRFQRMWPTLQQPWYFAVVSGIAIDGSGNVYTVERDNHRVRKFTPDGLFTTEWGGYGGGDGQFREPSDIAVDSCGYVYVADFGNIRIQKFTVDGALVAKWDRVGSGDGEFSGPHAVAVDAAGNVYVSDMYNYRVQKFTSQGEFMLKWGSPGSGDGEFSDNIPSTTYGPYGIGIAPDGSVYVADPGNGRIQKFTLEGKFVAKWPTGAWDIAVDPNGNVFVSDYGNHLIRKLTAEGEFVWERGGCCPENGLGLFYLPRGIAVDARGAVFAGDTAHVQKFSADGQFLTAWQSFGRANGHFAFPSKVSVSPTGEVYVADWLNKRIQKFSPDGRFLMKLEGGCSEGRQFCAPRGVATDAAGNIYVAGGSLYKFTAEGRFVKKVDGGAGDGWFGGLAGVASNRQGSVFTVESWWVEAEGHYENRVQKFTENLEYLTSWGTYGAGDGELLQSAGIAADDVGTVFVTDLNGWVQEFSWEGKFIRKWGHCGTGDGELNGPEGLAVDHSGNVYVADTKNCRVQKFDGDRVFVAEFGSQGSSFAQMNRPGDVAVGKTGEIYVADSMNNRIQVFRPVTQESNSRAVIVAGGGPYDGNLLWAATEMCANFAYRALVYQGFTKDGITYLSSDTQLDLDENGAPDDVDGEATNSNLKSALTSWAMGAGDAVVYLVDHGGKGTFRMSGKETLSVDDLSSWLDTLQGSITGKLSVVYDACQSGSFLSALSSSSGKGRIVITSTSPEEDAYFVNHGSISFSNYFWTHVFNGLSIRSAFELAKKSVRLTTRFQHPLLDDNGNGKGNDAEDGTLAALTFVGNGTRSFNSAPRVGAVSPYQTISGMNSALLYAEKVSDPDGIARVWAVIRPPSFTPGEGGSPIRELPAVDLVEKGNGRYEATREGFSEIGTYQIAVYATDRLGNTSVPKLTGVSVDSPLRRKAVIVAGGSQSNPLWPAIEKSVKLAHEALIFQGYTDEDITFMSPVTIPGVDELPTLENLEFAIKTWAGKSTQDLVLYLIGNGGDGTFQISPKEALSARDLKSWLDSLQETLSGKVTVISDGSSSGSFLPLLKPPADRQRILITSTSKGQAACFASDGDLSFSTFFWRSVVNGATVRESFVEAAISIRGLCPGQDANLDDNGNGKGNEISDGELARYFTIGSGILLAGDAPVIGSIMPKKALELGETSTTVWVKNVTTTGTLARVFAVITPPGFEGRASEAAFAELPALELAPAGNGRFQERYDRFIAPGTYKISAFAVDSKGNLSRPRRSAVVQSGESP